MKLLLLLLLTPIFMFAKVYYAKVEPYETVTLKSAVSALVVDVDLEAEGSVVVQKRVIHLDDTMDRLNLKTSKETLGILQETLKRQKSYFQRIDRLKTTSETQKDAAYYTFASTKTQVLEMQYRVAQLEDSIDKKSIILQNTYLYEVLVRKGDYVNPGSPLAKVADTSKAKLVLYLDTDTLADLQTKRIYIDGKETAYRVDKVWTVADEKYISAYRAEIYLPAPEARFSQLVKVEFK